MLAALLWACVGACVSHSTASDYRSVRALALARANLDLPQAQAHAASDEPDADVQALLAHPLDLAAAERIALLNNHELRAQLAELGIARGELVQASLFPNPEASVSVRTPDRAGRGLEWDLGADIDLTALIVRGARSEAAAALLDAARLRAAGDVLDLGLRVRLAFYSLLASQQHLELASTAADAFAASYEAARALHDAGNLTQLDLATEHAAFEAARVAVSEADADVQDDRERLNALLGLHGSNGQATRWQASGRLPEVQPAPAEAELEARALSASLELSATRAELTALQRQLDATQTAGALPELSLGVQAERRDAEWSVGPSLRAGLPVFSRQQGALVAGQARIEQLQQHYVAVSEDIRAAVRAARARSASAQQRALQYRDSVLPLRHQVVEQSVLQHNAMQIGVFQLLQARKEELESARMYIATLREYWLTRAQLDQLLAGRLAGATGPLDVGRAP